MKTFLVTMAIFLVTAVANIPLPILYEYHHKEEKIFGSLFDAFMEVLEGVLNKKK